MDCSMPGFPVHYQLPELAQAHVLQVGDANQPSNPLSSPSPPAFNLSQDQGLFLGVSSLYQVVQVLEFWLQHQSFQWIFRIDFLRKSWFDLFAVQGTLKSFLQHHSSKASALWCLAFFIVQLSHPYMTTGKTIALTRRIFVGNPTCQIILGMKYQEERKASHPLRDQCWLNFKKLNGASGKESACQCRRHKRHGLEQVGSLRWEDHLEKEMALRSSILAWKISWAKDPGELRSTGLQRAGHKRLSTQHRIRRLFYMISFVFFWNTKVTMQISKWLVSQSF